MSVARAGDYTLAVDLYAPGGQFVTSASGEATLGTGAGTVTVSVPLAAILAAGLDGPYSVRDGLLTASGQAATHVAEAPLLGTTGPLELQDILPGEVLLGEPVASAHDDSGEGTLDRLTFSLSAWVPAAGEYALEADLIGPGGARVVSVYAPGIPLVLGAGRNQIEIDFEGGIVGAGGSGVNTVRDLALTSVSAPTLHGLGLPAETAPLDASRWVAGDPSSQWLISSWERARARGEIPEAALYTSELARLRALQTALSLGRRSLASGLLADFVRAVESAPESAIAPATAEEIGLYAERLRASLA